MITDSGVLLRRFPVVSRQRFVDFEDVLAHELTAISPSLLHDDGNLRKRTKSNLLKRLELSLN